MCNETDLMVWVDENPRMMYSFEKSHERPRKGSVLPYMMLERHEVKRTATSEPMGDPVFT